MPEKECAHCGAPIPVRRTYCDDGCRRLAIAERRKLSSTYGKPSCRPRTCEICATTYRPTYPKQRTCGRKCGMELQGRLGKWNLNGVGLHVKVAYHECGECGRWLLVRKGRLQLCECGISYLSGMKRPQQPRRSCLACGGAVGPRAKYCSRACREGSPHYRELRRQAKDRRRARKSSAFVETVWRTRVFKRDGYICRLCNKPTKRDAVVPHPLAPTLDHIIPLASGGTHEPRNVQCAHFLCNSIKGDRGGGQLLLVG